MTAKARIKLRDLKPGDRFAIPASPTCEKVVVRVDEERRGLQRVYYRNGKGEIRSFALASGTSLLDLRSQKQVWKFHKRHRVGTARGIVDVWTFRQVNGDGIHTMKVSEVLNG